MQLVEGVQHAGDDEHTEVGLVLMVKSRELTFGSLIWMAQDRSQLMRRQNNRILLTMNTNLSIWTILNLPAVIIPDLSVITLAPSHMKGVNMAGTILSSAQS